MWNEIYQSNYALCSRFKYIATECDINVYTYWRECLVWMGSAVNRWLCWTLNRFIPRQTFCNNGQSISRSRRPAETAVVGWNLQSGVVREFARIVLSPYTQCIKYKLWLCSSDSDFPKQRGIELPQERRRPTLCMSSQSLSNLFTADPTFQCAVTDSLRLDVPFPWVGISSYAM